MMWGLAIALAVGFGGGWYCKGRFGATAAKVVGDVKSAG